MNPLKILGLLVLTMLAVYIGIPVVYWWLTNQHFSFLDFVSGAIASIVVRVVWDYRRNISRLFRRKAN